MANGYLHHQGTKFYPAPYYPIGAVYMSTEPTDPSVFFGGVWTRIQGRFLWATGSSPKHTGGSRTHSHTVNSHTHTYGLHYGVAYDNITSCNGGETLGLWNNGAWSYSATGASNHSGYTAYANQTGGYSRGTKWIKAETGGSAPSTNSIETLPPYFEVYMWYRAA